MVTYETYEAVAEAKTDGMSIAGTFRPDGTPVYYLVPEDISFADGMALAFEARNSRPMSDAERFLAEFVLDTNPAAFTSNLPGTWQ